ncbi:MAG: NADH-quinone oxidoreductase subunit M [Thiolinea sp.]
MLLTLIQPVRAARWSALTTTLLALLISLMLVAGFKPELSGFQYVERSVWISSLQVHYLLGVDGLSVLFLPFTCLLFSGVLLASWNAIRRLPQLFFALLLLLETTLLGVFTALDTLFFMLFWELSLLPLYFLISLWGAGPHRRYAAGKYVLFMLLGGIPLLFGFVVLALHHPQGPNFDYTQLVTVVHDPWLQRVVFLLLLTGFAFKLPLVPFHSWLPVIAQEGPAAVIALVAGLKIGAYGLLRFAIPLAPQAAQELQWLLMGLGMLGLLYGAIAALGQSNLRGLLAFASISHVGLVVLGISSFTVQGLQGAVFQLLNFTLSAGGLLILLAYLHQRLGSCHLLSLGGAAQSMPLLAALFLALGLASLGIPGSASFPAEFLLISGVLQSHPGAGLLALFSLVLGAAGFLRAFRKAFWGECLQPAVARAVDLTWRERLVVVIFVLVLLIFGLYPQPLLDVIAQSAADWLNGPR